MARNVVSSRAMFWLSAPLWLVLALLIAGSANATPVTVWFTTFGVEAGSVADLTTANPGVQVISPKMFIQDTTPLFDFTHPEGFPVDPTGTSRSDPATGFADWSITAKTALPSAWLLIGAHSDSADPNYACAPAGCPLGIEVDPADGWALVHLDKLWIPAGPFPGVYYMGINLGPLSAGETANLRIDYRVSEDLVCSGSNCFMPTALVAFVPEPATPILLSISVLGVAWRRFRS